MPHASDIVYPSGPDSPHAFDNVPLQPRSGRLDAPCPLCKGHGQWNSEIDLVSFRCTRVICNHCLGEGWVETGSDPIAVFDIVMTPEGHPQWITRYVPKMDIEK
jgi:hypothetical protein